MKFSILTLLTATGYIALAIAGLKEPLGWWRYASTIAWLLVLAYFIAMAMDLTNRPSAIFGRTALGCILAYGLLTWLPVSLSTDMDGPNFGAMMSVPGKVDVLPHHWFAAWWANASSQTSGRLTTPLATPFTYQVQNISVWLLPQTKAIETIAALNFSLIFGLVGGCLALWRNRAQERCRSPLHRDLSLAPPSRE